MMMMVMLAVVVLRGKKEEVETEVVLIASLVEVVTVVWRKEVDQCDGVSVSYPCPPPPNHPDKRDKAAVLGHRNRSKRGIYL